MSHRDASFARAIWQLQNHREQADSETLTSLLEAPENPHPVCLQLWVAIAPTWLGLTLAEQILHYHHSLPLQDQSSRVSAALAPWVKDCLGVEPSSPEVSALPLPLLERSHVEALTKVTDQCHRLQRRHLACNE